MVMCQAEDVEAVPRSIKSFNRNELFVGGELLELDGDTLVAWQREFQFPPPWTIRTHKR
jgi:hypothetical protein